MISRITSKNLVGAFIAFMVLTLSLLVSAPVYARTVGATLSGTVTDPSRAPITNVQLTMRNTATGVTAGFYLVPNLLPGSYDVIFSGPGFTTVVESDVVPVLGRQRALNRSIQVGQATQKLEVTATAEAVQLTSSTLCDEVNATSMRELPVENRDLTSLANLKPGVAPVRTQPLAFSPSGDRGSLRLWKRDIRCRSQTRRKCFPINGISVDDYTNNSPGSVLGGALGVVGFRSSPS